MNAKLAKKLRQDMRHMGFDPKETAYNPHKTPVFAMAKVDDKGQLVFDALGTVRVKVQKGEPKELAPCGRKLYKDMKEGLRIGEIQ